MAGGVPPELRTIGGPYGRHSVTLDGKDPGFVHAKRVAGALPNARMRLLHFENAFGAAYASEYCQDAMLSFVLLMARNARLNADRLARLTGATSAEHPAEGKFFPGAAAVCEAAHVLRAGVLSM